MGRELDLKTIDLMDFKLGREIKRQVEKESVNLQAAMPSVDDLSEVLDMFGLLGSEVSNKLIKKGEPEFRRRRNTQLIAEHYKK